VMDDLVQRLRANELRIDHGINELCGTAADRIEALQAQLDEAGRKLNRAKYGEPVFSWEVHKAAMADLRARAEAAEQALAAAVNRLTGMRDDEVGYRHVSHFRRGAAVTLAALPEVKG